MACRPVSKSLSMCAMLLTTDTVNFEDQDPLCSPAHQVEHLWTSQMQDAGKQRSRVGPMVEASVRLLCLGVGDVALVVLAFALLPLLRLLGRCCCSANTATMYRSADIQSAHAASHAPGLCGNSSATDPRDMVQPARGGVREATGYVGQQERCFRGDRSQTSRCHGRTSKRRVRRTVRLAPTVRRKCPAFHSCRAVATGLPAESRNSKQGTNSKCTGRTRRAVERQS